MSVRKTTKGYTFDGAGRHWKTAAPAVAALKKAREKMYKKRQAEAAKNKKKKKSKR
jgi:hypothetical protein